MQWKLLNVAKWLISKIFYFVITGKGYFEENWYFILLGYKKNNRITDFDDIS